MSDPVSHAAFRLFISLAIPEPIKDAIEKAQSVLRRGLPPKAARWTKREQFHLTLKFLGNVSVERLSDLTQTCRLICQAQPALRLVCRKTGFFPNARFPRVLWVGVTDLDGRLEQLWQALQTAVQPFTSETPEANFSGHVTLARLNRLRRNEAEAVAGAATPFEQTVFGEWTAQRLELMRSQLSAEGAIHSILAELPFRADT